MHSCRADLCLAELGLLI